MEHVHGESLARCVSCSAQAKTPVPLAITTAILVKSCMAARPTARSENGDPLSSCTATCPQNIPVGADGAVRVLDFESPRPFSRAPRRFLAH